MSSTGLPGLLSRRRSRRLRMHPQTPEPADAQLDRSTERVCKLVALADPVGDDRKHRDDPETEGDARRRVLMRCLRGAPSELECAIAVAVATTWLCSMIAVVDQVIGLDRWLRGYLA